MPKTSNYQMQAAHAERMSATARSDLLAMGAKQVGPDCFVIDSLPEGIRGIPHTEAVAPPSQKELARKALKGLAVSNDAVRAAQASYKGWEEYGLTDHDMRVAITAALKEMTKCNPRKR